MNILLPSFSSKKGIEVLIENTWPFRDITNNVRHEKRKAVEITSLAVEDDGSFTQIEWAVRDSTL